MLRDWAVSRPEPRRYPRPWFILLSLPLLSCEAPPAQDPQVTATKPPAESIRNIVDSILPVEEEIRRFKAQLSGPHPTTLEHGAESRELLVRQFVTAIEARDTTTLLTLTLSPAEFIEFYYPSSPYTRPPYRQNPALLWFLIQQNSKKGMSRALDRFGGHPLRYQAPDCQSTEPQGDNHFWECTMRIGKASEGQTPVRLFGSIMERAGRFKFVSYANDL